MVNAKGGEPYGGHATFPSHAAVDHTFSTLFGCGGFASPTASRNRPAGRVGLDLVAAIPAPNDQPNLGGGSTTKRH